METCPFHSEVVMQRIEDIESGIKDECKARLDEDKAIHEKINGSFQRLQYWFMGTMAMFLATLITILLKGGK